MAKLCLMIGVPGSGKSTFAKNHLLNITYISRDEIRFSLISDEDEYFAKEYEVFALYVQKIREGLMRGETVVADSTNLNEAARKKLFNAIGNKQFYEKYKVEKTFIYMDIPLTVCRVQNLLRTGRAVVPDRVIDSMYQKLEYPTKEEGFTRGLIVHEGEDAEWVMFL